MWSCCAFWLHKPDRELAASLVSEGLFSRKSWRDFCHTWIPFNGLNS